MECNERLQIDFPNVLCCNCSFAWYMQFTRTLSFNVISSSFQYSAYHSVFEIFLNWYVTLLNLNYDRFCKIANLCMLMKTMVKQLQRDIEKLSKELSRAKGTKLDIKKEIIYSILRKRLSRLYLQRVKQNHIKQNILSLFTFLLPHSAHWYKFLNYFGGIL